MMHRQHHNQSHRVEITSIEHKLIEWLAMAFSKDNQERVEASYLTKVCLILLIKESAQYLE